MILFNVWLQLNIMKPTPLIPIVQCSFRTHNSTEIKVEYDSSEIYAKYTAMKQKLYRISISDEFIWKRKRKRVRGSQKEFSLFYRIVLSMINGFIEQCEHIRRIDFNGVRRCCAYHTEWKWHCNSSRLAKFYCDHARSRLRLWSHFIHISIQLRLGQLTSDLTYN